MRLKVELPEMGVGASVEMLESRAPTVCRAIYESLEAPIETRTSHACFSGHQIFCFLPPFSEPPPVENNTLRPSPGDVMFFYAAEHAYAWMQDEGRMAPDGPSAAVYELAFNYGAVDLGYWAAEGWHGSLVGRVVEGLDEFARAGSRVLAEGATALRVAREVP